MVDDGPGFELGIAEHLSVALANKQPCQGQDVTIGTGTNARCQFLGLRFQVRAQGLVQGHGGLLRQGAFAVVPRLSLVMNKSSTNSSAAYTTQPEVEDLLGKPDDTLFEANISPLDLVGKTGGETAEIIPGRVIGLKWRQGQNGYSVKFDEQGRVSSKEIATISRPSWFEKVTDWLGL